MPQHVVKTERDATWTVNVDPEGWITLDHAGHFGERRLTQAEAAKLAWALCQGVEDSVWRTQRSHNAAWFHQTEQIIARANSPLGRAKQALVDGNYGIRFENGQLV